MKTFTLYRYDSSKDYTLGILFGENGYICDTLELPWLENAHDISCIPEGQYPIQKYFSPHRKEECILVAHISNRTGIEIHEANSIHDIQGCIGVGIKSLEILLHSRQNLDILLELLGDEVGVLTVKGMSI